jgi:hypothetical protein
MLFSKNKMDPITFVYIPIFAYFIVIFVYLCLNKIFKWSKNRRDSHFDFINKIGLWIAKIYLILMFYDGMSTYFMDTFYPKTPQLWLTPRFEKILKINMFISFSFSYYAFYTKKRRLDAIWILNGVFFLLFPLVFHIIVAVFHLNDWGFYFNSIRFEGLLN